MPSNRLGLPCPQCGHTSPLSIRVRRTPEGHFWRRRECPECGHRYSTVQLAEMLEVPGSVGWRNRRVSINWSPFRAQFARALTEVGFAFHTQIK